MERKAALQPKAAMELRNALDWKTGAHNQQCVADSKFGVGSKIAVVPKDAVESKGAASLAAIVDLLGAPVVLEAVILGLDVGADLTTPAVDLKDALGSKVSVVD